MRLAPPPEPLPAVTISIQGSHSGSECRVAVWKLIDFTDGLTFRAAENWARAALEGEHRWNGKS
jgi:hypothetical protein